jgi:hypothetical protein
MSTEWSMEEYVELKTEVRGYIYPYIAARTNCRMEDSHPEEGGYAEDVSVWLTGKDRSGKGIEVDITQFIEEKVLGKLGDRLFENYYDRE